MTNVLVLLRSGAARGVCITRVQYMLIGVEAGVQREDAPHPPPPQHTHLQELRGSTLTSDCVSSTVTSVKIGSMFLVLDPSSSELPAIYRMRGARPLAICQGVGFRVSPSTMV